MMFSDKAKRVMCIILAGIMILSVGSVVLSVIF
jgi:hypothetical protein